MIEIDRRKEWRLSNGWSHREDGPAILWADGRESWCLYATAVTQKEVEEFAQNKKEEREEEVRQARRVVLAPEQVGF